MKKIVAFIVVALTLSFCVACGPYGDYAGVYTYSSSNATFTVTLSSSGNFKFERKDKSATSGILGSEKYNVMQGTFTVENDTIIISYTYYDELDGNKTESAKGKIKTVGNKTQLIITWEDGSKNTYTKK